jgi:diguanylate cyclase (GGDEF)-like protein
MFTSMAEFAGPEAEAWPVDMPIDVPSVIATSGIVTAALGGLLIFAWHQSRSQCLLLWGIANLLVAVGTTVPLASASVAEEFVDVANAAVLIGYGLIWAGVRSFERRPLSLAVALSGGVLWLVAAQFPLFAGAGHLRAALSFLVSGSFVTATALEVASGRDERLWSRNAALFLFCIHSVILIGRVPESLLGHWIPDHVISRSQLLAAFSLETLLFVVASAFILLAMVKERSEGEQIARASTDALTGIANRRAFFEVGEARIEENRRIRIPTAVALFDLDHFKQINDAYGHAAGDAALKLFARTAAAELRQRDLLARIGGEEFACVMPNLSAREAAAVADRIRIAFAAAALDGGGATFHATVSAGVFVASESDLSLDRMLAGADRALYEAKRGGRNRVEHSRPDLVWRDGEPVLDGPPRPGSVVRSHRIRA